MAEDAIRFVAISATQESRQGGPTLPRKYRGHVEGWMSRKTEVRIVNGLFHLPGKHSVPLFQATVAGFRGFQWMEINSNGCFPGT